MNYLLKITWQAEEKLAISYNLSFFEKTACSEFGCSLTLASLQLDKEMYVPGYIEAMVQVTPYTENPKSAGGSCYTFSNVNPAAFDKLLGSKVSLFDKVEDGNALATDYIVFDIQPEYKSSSTFYVKFIIYSPEKILTFKKFNKCHILESLGADIFTGIAKEHPNEIRQSSCKHLQHLILSSGKEFLQPYLVQYDETELDFLTRMANRCGEFMFYENGVWQLGLDIKKAPQKIEKDFESLTFKRSEKRDLAKFWVNNYTRAEGDNDDEDPIEIVAPTDENDPKNSKNKETAAKAWKDDYDKTTDLARKDALNEYMYDKEYITKIEYKKNKEDIKKKRKEEEKKEAEEKKATKEWQTYTGPADEYLASHMERGKFSAAYKKATVDYMIADAYWWLSTVTSSLEKLTYIDIIKSFFSKAGFTTVMALFKCRTFDKIYNSQNVDRYKEFSDFAKDCDGEMKITPLTSSDAVKKYTSEFFTGVLACETEAERQAIHVDMGTNYTLLRLGDIVPLLGKKYVVVNITLKSSKKDSTSTEADTTLAFEAIPLLEKDGKSYAYPAPIKGGTSRKAGAQMAIVTSVFDPLQLGRVQIRYPWQSAPAPIEVKQDDKTSKLEVPYSPWIRIAMPYTSKGSGIRFLPQVDDEIMVDYEYGDIERPYMIGALESKENPGNELYYGEEEKYVIRSPFGQYIKFEAPVSRSKFLANAVSPLFGTLATYVPPIKNLVNDGFEKAFGKDLSGGISMCDSCGTFEISMSTEERSVTINSMLGDVTISAFTGITINSPNGDITIKGKNVTIDAGNELTLKSGTNQKPTSFENGSRADWWTDVASEFAVKPAYGWLKKQGKVIDLSLIRCVLESIIKPVGGEMLIKSDTFLRLEAGGNETDLPDAAYATNLEGYKDEIEKKLKQVMVKDTIMAVNKSVDEIVNLTRAYSIEIGAKKDAYKQKIAQIYTAVKPQGKDRLYLFTDKKPDGILYADLDFNKFLKDNEIETAEDIVEKALKGEWKEREDLNDTHPNLDSIHGKIYRRLVHQSLGRDIIITDLPALKNAKQAAAQALEDLIRTINHTNVFQAAQAEDFFADKVTLSMEAFGHSVDSDHKIYDIEKIKGYVNGLNLTEEAKKINLTEALTQQGRGNEMVVGEAFTVFRRKMMFETLHMLKEDKYILLHNDDNVANAVSRFLSAKMKNRVIIDINDKDVCCESAKNWLQFLHCVKEYDKDEDAAVASLTESLKDAGVVKKAGISAWNEMKGLGKELIDWENIKELGKLWENHIRNPKVKGEILLSDPQGNTVSFKDGTLLHTRTNPFDDIKDVLEKI